MQHNRAETRTWAASWDSGIKETAPRSTYNEPRNTVKSRKADMAGAKDLSSFTICLPISRISHTLTVFGTKKKASKFYLKKDIDFGLGRGSRSFALLVALRVGPPLFCSQNMFHNQKCG